MTRRGPGQWSVLAGSTLAFTVCFAVWMMFAVIGIPIKKMLDLNETQFGLLAATPVLTGSLIRLPLGMWTDTYGGRIVFFLLMLVLDLFVFHRKAHVIHVKEALGWSAFWIALGLAFSGFTMRLRA